MRILYFHQYFTTPKGAGGIRSYQMARQLIERGHRVTMVTGRTPGALPDMEGPFTRGVRRGVVDGIDVIEVDLVTSNSLSFVRRAFAFLSFAARTSRLAFTEKYDLLFATTTPLTIGIPGILAKWLRRKPFIFEVRDLWPELPKAMGVIRNPLILGALSVLEWASYRSADRLVALSPGIADGIVRRGVPPDRVALVPNGCDIDIFQGAENAWRPEEVALTDLMAVFSGTHGRANGLDAVLDAAAVLMQRQRDDIKIVLVGDGMMKPHLQSRVTHEGLSNVILHAPVPKMRLAGLLAATDIGLQILDDVPAFYFGTSPNKFFDYLAAGRAVLTNYPGWVAQLVEENSCGCMVPPRNAVAFADALEHIADNRTLLNDMGENAIRLAQRDFDRESLANRWADWVTSAT